MNNEISIKGNNKKRKKLFDQYRDGIISPPKSVDTVQLITNNIFQFTCNSSSDKDIKYTITMQPNFENNLIFTCNCFKRNEISNEVTQNCKHITAVVLYICLSQINNADNYIKNMEASKEITDELTLLFDKIKNINLND